MNRSTFVIDQAAFRFLLTRKGFRNVAAVAREIGIRKGALHSIYWGSLPKPELQAKIAAAVDASIDQIWRPVNYTSLVG